MLCSAEQQPNSDRFADANAVHNEIATGPALHIIVTSGLHSGEQIKLNDSPILLGGNEDCDIYLAEPGLTQAHLIAERHIDHDGKSKVLVSPILNSGAEAYFVEGKIKKTLSEPRLFHEGESLCLGGVWISIKAGDNLRDDEDSLADEENTRLVFHSKKTDLSASTSRHHQREESEQDKHFLRWAGLKAGSLFLSSIGVCALTISVAQGVSSPSGHPALASDFTSQEAHRTPEQNDSYGDSLLSSIRENIAQDAYAADVENAQLNQPFAPSNQKTNVISLAEQMPYLQNIFTQMLSARELPLTVSLSLNNKNDLSVEGHLDQAKHSVLNRMLVRFQKEQKLEKPVINRIQTAFSSLPFEIVQVTSGRYGNIVTQSGERLFVGDQLAGYQLVAIQDHQLVFSGKSRVTVAW